MKKILFPLIIFLVSVSGVVAQAVKLEDKQVLPMITAFSEVRKENEAKAKIMLPPPVPPYQDLVDFTTNLGFSIQNTSSEAELFLEQIIKDVSGDLRYYVMRLDTNYPYYPELYLLVIYFYVTQRYTHDDDLRASVYQRIMGDEMGAKFFQQEQSYQKLLLKVTTEIAAITNAMR